MGIVSDIAIFVLKRDVKVQLTNNMGISDGLFSVNRTSVNRSLFL